MHTNAESNFLQRTPSIASLQLLQEFYATVPLILFEVGGEGRILNLNPTFETVTGWPATAWIGREFIDLIAPEDRLSVLDTYQQLLSGREHGFMQVRIVAANGATLTLEAWIRHMVVEPQPGQSDLHFVGFAQDITERMAHVQRLQMLDDLLKSVTDAIIVTDPAFIITEWNQAAERIYGWQRHEVLGKSVVGVLGIEYIDTTQAAVLDEYLRTGHWHGEVIQRRKDGERIHILASVNALFDARGRRSGTVAVNRDITAEMKARQALTRIERIYRQAIRGIGGVPYQRDYRTPGYAFIGDGIEELTGYSAAELTGALFTSRLRKIEAYGEHAGVSHEERIALARQGAGIVWREDYLFERKDGSLVWLADHAVPLLDDKGVAIGSLGILLDITARKQAEEEQQRLQEHIDQMERLETVGRLAGGVAHDFNNMLAVILMRTEMALQLVDALSPLHRHLTEIYKTAQRSADLTRQLLGFARRQPIAPRPLDLNQTIEDALPMLRHLLGEEIELCWQPADALGTVNMDPAQIDQILVNLCINARDAIAGVGKVTIATCTAELDEAYVAAHPDAHAGAYSVLRISDTGCGMTPDVLAHIFEPFFTTKEVGRGTGLGLATIYGIVQQNYGHIVVHSIPGIGTTFQIYLPCYQAAPVRATPAPSMAMRAAGATILVVEDNANLLEMTAEGLRQSGYRVLTAISAVAAQQLADEYAGAIDLLLTDVIMPEIDGVAFARRLQRQHPHVRVVYMSGHPAHLLEQRGMLEPGVQVLRKPFTLADLTEAVSMALLKENEGNAFATTI